MWQNSAPKCFQLDDDVAPLSCCRAPLEAASHYCTNSAKTTCQLSNVVWPSPISKEVERAAMRAGDQMAASSTIVGRLRLPELSHNVSQDYSPKTWGFKLRGPFRVALGLALQCRGSSEFQLEFVSLISAICLLNRLNSKSCPLVHVLIFASANKLFTRLALAVVCSFPLSLLRIASGPRFLPSIPMTTRMIQNFLLDEILCRFGLVCCCSCWNFH